MDSNIIYISIFMAYFYCATVAIMSIDAADELEAMEFRTHKQEKLIGRYVKRWRIYAVLSGSCGMVLLGRMAFDIVRACGGMCFLPPARW